MSAVCEVLRKHTAHIALFEARQYARYLTENTDREFRASLVDLMIDVAAADDNVTVAETNLIRRLVELLGLTQDDYLASQSRHRDKLAVLKA